MNHSQTESWLTPPEWQQFPVGLFSFNWIWMNPLWTGLWLPWTFAVLRNLFTPAWTMKTSPRYINYNIDLMSSFSFIVYFTFQNRQPFISDPGFVKFTQQGKLKIMDVLLLPYNFIQKFHCYISLYLVGLRSIVHYCLDFIINILLRSIVHYCLVFIKKYFTRYWSEQAPEELCLHLAASAFTSLFRHIWEHSEMEISWSRHFWSPDKMKDLAFTKKLRSN